MRLSAIALISEPEREGLYELPADWRKEKRNVTNYEVI